MRLWTNCRCFAHPAAGGGQVHEECIAASHAQAQSREFTWFVHTSGARIIIRASPAQAHALHKSIHVQFGDVLEYLVDTLRFRTIWDALGTHVFPPCLGRGFPDGEGANNDVRMIQQRDLEWSRMEDGPLLTLSEFEISCVTAVGRKETLAASLGERSVGDRS